MNTHLIQVVFAVLCIFGFSAYLFYDWVVKTEKAMLKQGVDDKSTTWFKRLILLEYSTKGVIQFCRISAVIVGVAFLVS